ncbi:MAG: signal recognition particle-docking protein FtsY [Deltaproteobacteria bacterium]|nr:signal recognition particle-docking protein FtsY [Deltaproteobacteria bacterium]
MAWKEGLFSRLSQGLSRTREVLAGRLEQVLTGTNPSEEDWEALEEVLLGADFGVRATQRLLDSVRGPSRVRDGGGAELLQQEITTLLKERPGIGSGRYAVKPWVVMMVGVNGVGKTTTVGKLAHRLRRDGKKVLLAAADTFRAGAIEQLEIWGERVGAEVIKHGPGQDPSGVVFDAAQAAQKRAADVLLIDTAGRLHNKVNLVEELKKMRRVLGRVQEGAPHETLLVVDASTGQNAVVQARIFQDAVAVSGIALTKLDGTAKGGVVLSIQQELAIPMEYVGVGEGVDDLQEFDPDAFARAFFAS